MANVTLPTQISRSGFSLTYVPAREDGSEDAFHSFFRIDGPGVDNFRYYKDGRVEITGNFSYIELEWILKVFSNNIRLRLGRNHYIFAVPSKRYPGIWHHYIVTRVGSPIGHELRPAVLDLPDLGPSDYVQMEDVPDQVWDAYIAALEMHSI